MVINKEKGLGCLGLDPDDPLARFFNTIDGDVTQLAAAISEESFDKRNYLETRTTPNCRGIELLCFSHATLATGTRERVSKHRNLVEC